MFEEYQMVLAYIIATILLYFLGRHLVGPMKIVIKLIFSIALGAMSLVLINLAGSFFNYQIALNPVTAFITGILGIPGVFLLVVLKQVFQV